MAYFIGRVCVREGREPPQFNADAQQLLRTYSWPGNVRELQNLCERVCVMESGQMVGPDAIRPLLVGPLKTASAPALNLQYRDGQILADAEQDLILRTLDRFHGHRERTARALGIGLRTLGLKLKKWREEGVFQEPGRMRLTPEPELVEC
jgi:DNA-binding NtrC family response regulator